MVANVASMVVVTGEGEIRSCSRSEDRQLYDAVLCGLGRCGVIVSVNMEARAARPRVRTVYLLYDDHLRWLADQQALAGSVHGMEGLCSPSAQGLRGTHGRLAAFATWFYPRRVCIEYDPAGVAGRAVALSDRAQSWRWSSSTPARPGGDSPGGRPGPRQAGSAAATSGPGRKSAASRSVTARVSQRAWWSSATPRLKDGGTNRNRQPGPDYMQAPAR
jgi:FAD/FMN-containing dehydrogenase